MKRKAAGAGWDDLPEDVKVHVATKVPFRSQLALRDAGEKRVVKEAIPLRARAAAPTVARGMDAMVRLVSRAIERALRTVVLAAEHDEWCAGPLWHCVHDTAISREFTLAPHAPHVAMLATAFRHDPEDPHPAFGDSPGVEVFFFSPSKPPTMFADAVTLRPDGVRVAALRPAVRPAGQLGPGDRALAAAYELAMEELNEWLAKRRR